MDKKILSWCLFDFANSSFSAVISAVIFPVYYANYIVGNEKGLGDLWWGRAVALSMAMVALSSPFLGGIADFVRIRKKMLILYTSLCIISVSLFYFLQKGMIIEGFILIVLANIGMEGGLVFYNSFLPEIAETENQGRVSAWGFAVGYAGSIISLLLALFLINKGFLNFVWPMVALFFGIFSIPSFLYLPKDEGALDSKNKVLYKAAFDGLYYTLNTLKKIIKDKEKRKFLIAYLIYEDGVNTVIVFSSVFAATTFQFRSEELILMYLIVQATALIGAFLMAKPIDFWGPKKVVMLSLIMWSCVAIASFLVKDKAQFFVIAIIAGLGLGTIQAATRAFYAQFIPKGNESEYFGVYSFVGKSSAIIGPLMFGYISTVSGSQRPAVLSVAFFFIIGLLIIRTVNGGLPNLIKGKSKDDE
jgi:UMF1 family MFS transporter